MPIGQFRFPIGLEKSAGKSSGMTSSNEPRRSRLSSGCPTQFQLRTSTFNSSPEIGARGFLPTKIVFHPNQKNFHGYTKTSWTDFKSKCFLFKMARTFPRGKIQQTGKSNAHDITLRSRKFGQTFAIRFAVTATERPASHPPGRRQQPERTGQDDVAISLTEPSFFFSTPVTPGPSSR